MEQEIREKIIELANMVSDREILLRALSYFVSLVNKTVDK